MILWLFVFGYVLQHLATIFQIMRIMKNKNTELVSLETNIFFSIATVCRMIWMWDSMLSSFFLAYVEMLVAIGSLGFLIYLYQQYKGHDFYRAEIKTPTYLSFPALLAAILILSFFFHPGSKNSYYLSLQMFVSINIFSECIGLIPQLYLISNTKETGNLSEYYIVFLAAARFFRLFFWFKMWMDGNSFISLIIADLVHTGVLGTFIYTFRKNMHGGSMPSFGDGGDSRKKIF